MCTGIPERVVLAVLCFVLLAEPVQADEKQEQVRKLLDAGRYGEAEAQAQVLVQRAEVESGGNALEVAEALDLLVESLWRGGKVQDPRSEELALRAVAIKEAVLGREHGALRKSLNNLGLLRYFAGDYAGARPVLERALAISEVALGPDHPDVATSLNSVGTLLREMGEYAEARRMYERALDIRERRLGPDHALTAASLGNLGLLLRTMGKYGEAKPYLERAMEVQERSLGPLHPTTANMLINLGNLLADMGDQTGARSAYERALSIREKVFGPEHPDVAQVLHNLAILLHESGDDALARTYFERALVIREQHLKPDHPSVAGTLNSLALLLADMGEHGQAKPLYERALAIRERTLGPGHPQVADTLLNMGRTLRAMGEFAGARSLYERGLLILQTALGPDHPEVAKALVGLAELFWDQDVRGQEEALSRATRAAAIQNRYLRETLAVLPERQALRWVRSRERPEEVLFSGLIAARVSRDAWLAACWEWTLRRRGLVLEELAARHRAVLHEESAEARQAWNRLAEARDRLAKLWVGGPDDREPQQYRAKLDEATRGKEQAEAVLAQISSRFRRDRRLAETGLKEVRRALPEGAALVEVVRVPIRLAKVLKPELHDIALILKPEGPSVFADLGPSERLDRLEREWREVLKDTSFLLATDSEDAAARARLDDAGSQLRRAFWDAIAGKLGHARTVFLVPDGFLHRVSVGALPAGSGGYLIETGPAVHVLSTGRDLVRLRQEGAETTPGHGLLALGAPDFDASETARMASLGAVSGQLAYRGERSTCPALWAGSFGPIPEAGRELAQIRALLENREPVRVLQGVEASEERFKREAPGRRILHLATHGFFLQGECASALAGERSSGAAAVVSENPLLLSGLVLAGANRAHEARQDGEDGVLTAEEIAALDLSGVELVVLSACDTGRGEVAVGEGIFGLRRALELAGARTVVMSLWPVPDQQTRRWMSSFYEQRNRGASIIEASQKASLGVLQGLRREGRPTHPYLWAGFVAAGDWK